MKNFTKVPNELIDRVDLSLQEKGFLSVIYRNIEGWKIYEKDIIARSNNGRDCHRKLLKKFVEYGFIKKLGGDKYYSKELNKIVNTPVYYELIHSELLKVSNSAKHSELLIIGQPVIGQPVIGRP